MTSPRAEAIDRRASGLGLSPRTSKDHSEPTMDVEEESAK